VIGRLLKNVRSVFADKDLGTGRSRSSVVLNQPLNPIDTATIGAYNKVRSFGPKPLLCYAPFNSMVFGPLGTVSACCHSYKASDNYPEKTIKEIWNGGVYAQLRAHLENNSLPAACAFCKAHLDSGAHFGVASRTYDSFLPIKDGYPTIMEFFLDLTCNLECIMCTGEYSSSIRKNREHLPPHKNIYGNAFLEELDEFIPYLKKASFVGGEPFLIDYYYKIWEKIFELNPDCTIALTTNGTILSEKVKRVLERGKFEIRLSLDGLTKDVYEGIRKNANFDKVMENLKYLHAYCKKKNTLFEIVPCPQKSNWHQMPKMVEFANSLDALLYFSSAVRYPFHVCLWPLPSEELKAILAQLAGYNFPSETNTEKHNKQIYNDFVSEVKMWVKAAIKRETEVEKAPIGGFDAKLRSAYFGLMTDYVNREKGLSEKEKKEKIAQLTEKIDGLLKAAPINFNQDEFFNFLTDIPMAKFVSWAHTASLAQVIDRFVNLQQSPYK